jgi:hypothetical protein
MFGIYMETTSRFTQLTQHDTNTSHIYTTVYTTDSTWYINLAPLPVWPLLCGSSIPFIHGFCRMYAAKGSACNMYNIGAIGHPWRFVFAIYMETTSRFTQLTQHDTNTSIFIPRFTQLTQHDTNTSHIYTTVYTTDFESVV